MLNQIIKIVKLLGFKNALRMKKHHEQGLAYVRGFSAASCWWTLLNEGILDKLDHRQSLDWTRFLESFSGDREVLEAIVEYLDGVGLLEHQDDTLRLSEQGEVLMAEPRGLLELLWAYEPCLAHLGELLRGEKKYGRDLTRRITFVGRGSGRLCEQLPYPVMRRMVQDLKAKMVLDLGCGDMAFLAGLCRSDRNIRCLGIDNDADMIAYDQKLLRENDHAGRLFAQQGDMFNLPELSVNLLPIDCITACDTFHEYLQYPNRLIELLQQLKRRFAGVRFVIGEFCLQDPAWLKRHKTATLEHHLFHRLSGQQIGSAQTWRDLFQKAALEIIEEQVYNIIGHGYFALK